MQKLLNKEDESLKILLSQNHSNLQSADFITIHNK